MDRLQYNNKALVGNWYEDRLDASKAPIPELERTGKYRVTPLKMIETTPDLYVTSNQAYHGPQVPIVTPPPAAFISKSTLHLAAHHRTPPHGTRTHGFGAIVPRHQPGHDERMLHTTTHSTYGGQYADTVEKRQEVDSSLTQIQQSKPAGKVYRDNVSGIRTGGATDERLQLGDTDPKCHSFVQRSWLGHDGPQQSIITAATAAAAAAAAAHTRTKNIEGLALKGLGEQATFDRANTDHEKKFYKKNDTLRRDTGIWND